MDKWETLKKIIETQVEFCERRMGASGIWGNTARICREVLKMMDKIDEGTEYNYISYLGLWKTEDEVKEMLKDDE